MAQQPPECVCKIPVKIGRLGWAEHLCVTGKLGMPREDNGPLGWYFLP